MSLAFDVDPMIETIANESRSLEEYARRVDAYVSTLSRKPTQRMLIDAWCACKSTKYSAQLGTKVRSELRAARSKRERQSEQLWGSLCKNIDSNEEE